MSKSFIIIDKHIIRKSTILRISKYGDNVIHIYVYGQTQPIIVAFSGYDEQRIREEEFERIANQL